MRNKWEYQGLSDVMFSDQNQESYRKSAEFLGDRPMEDWGCGMGWAHYFFSPENYKGIDGSIGFVSEAIDLSTYTSNTENILLRSVIEYNLDWLKILQNAKASFTNKLCIVIFNPFSDETNLMFMDTNDIPMMSFKKQDILDVFSDCKVREETITSVSPYGQEWILYVEK